MAKKKRKISDIKSALLSNTHFIKNTEEEKQLVTKNVVEIPENAVQIDKQNLSRLKILANYYGKDTQHLVNEAINHYLRLKKLDIDQALKNIVVGEEDE